MRIAIITTFRHPSRLLRKEHSVMQPAAPELIAALCPPHAEIEIYNEKERDVPLDRDWDLVFFSYLDPFYEHTKILSSLFRRRGMITVAGGRHASLFPHDCLRYFDAVVVGEPEANVPRLIVDFEKQQLAPLYRHAAVPPGEIPTWRYDLVDWRTNRFHAPSVEASRGCPFACNFCVLTGRESYRHRPIAHVLRDIERMRWNEHFFGVAKRTFMFYDNNLGGSPRYMRELCEALIPLKRTWGCSLTFNILEDDELVRLLAKAGCRFVYTGIESLNPESIDAMNKRQNRLQKLAEVVDRAYRNGILLSVGLMIGSDGDTNAYLERIPDYLAELRLFSIMFLGIVCPYPGTPYFSQVVREGRLLPGVTSRDLDTYTLCHRPKHLEPSEVADHYRRLCKTLGRLPNVVHHCTSKFGLSDRPGYNAGLVITSVEILGHRHNLANRARTFIAGRDPIEASDAALMRQLGIAPQVIGPSAGEAEGLQRSTG